MRRVALVLLALVVLAACNRSDDKADDAKSSVEQGREVKTVQPGKLTVCTRVPFAPFEYEEAGELRGIDVDLAKALTGRLGLSADFRKTDDPLGDVAAGKCDVAASALSVDKDAPVEFSPSYFKVREVIAVRSGDEAKYKDFAALKGKPVGFPHTAAARVYATDNPDVVMRDFPGQDDAVAAVAAGSVVAAVVDQAVLLAHAMAGERVAAAAVLDEIDDYALAFKKGNSALRAAVENALTLIRSDDTYRTILLNYLGSSAGQA